MTPIRKTVVVLGAGPAGLSIAYELKRRSVDYIVLEKGAVPGESFSHYPKNIFFGPWLNNTLPGSRVAWNWRLRRATQSAYTWYLGEYARHNQLPIHYGREVLQVDREGDGFRVHTTQGIYQCQLLVNCSGYFSTPNVPNYPGQNQSPLVFLHSQNYREAADLTRRMSGEGKRVLVVGAGLTAGETLVDLHRSGYKVSLSHRGPLVFGPSPLREAVLAPINWLLERATLALKLRPNSNPPMAGGLTQKLINSKQVATYPGIDRFEGSTVVFVDGQRCQLDAVVWGTGYNYTTAHLRGLLGDGPVLLNRMESSEVPGLFFLGLDHQRTYRSRFLRGIRADARILGEILAERMAKAPLPRFAEEYEFDLEKIPALV
ncbi:NAD(P)-binding domain-containing protein [bacterium]|nr:NAD(P)-binding domain-containing protein [bacterium]